MQQTVVAHAQLIVFLDSVGKTSIVYLFLETHFSKMLKKNVIPLMYNTMYCIYIYIYKYKSLLKSILK